MHMYVMHMILLEAVYTCIFFLDADEIIDKEYNMNEIRTVSTNCMSLVLYFSEMLYEDESFPQRELAALVASKVRTKLLHRSLTHFSYLSSL